MLSLAIHHVRSTAGFDKFLTLQWLCQNASRETKESSHLSGLESEESAVVKKSILEFITRHLLGCIEHRRFMSVSFVSICHFFMVETVSVNYIRDLYCSLTLLFGLPLQGYFHIKNYQFYQAHVYIQAA